MVARFRYSEFNHRHVSNGGARGEFEVGTQCFDGLCSSVEPLNLCSNAVASSIQYCGKPPSGCNSRNLIDIRTGLDENSLMGDSIREYKVR